MKSMLYAGAALMIGASIYGFVHYKQTKNRKAFREMYSEKKAAAPAVTPATDALKTAEPEKTVTVPAKTGNVKKKAVTRKEQTGPVQPIAEEDKMIPTEITIPDEPLTRPEPAKESSALKTVKKKKIRKEFFSRGRMPDNEVLTEPVKKETKKTESKQL